MIFVILVQRKRKKQYIQYIDEVYNAERLTSILTEVSHIIGANILKRGEARL